MLQSCCVLLGMFAADPTPQALKAWEAKLAAVRAIHVKPRQEAVEKARIRAAQNGTQRNGEILSERRRELEDAQKRDYRPLTLLPPNPKKGEIGYIRVGKVIEHRGVDTVVELSEVNTDSTGRYKEPHAGPHTWQIILKGEGESFAVGETVALNGVFLVCDIAKDKTKAAMVERLSDEQQGK